MVPFAPLPGPVGYDDVAAALNDRYFRPEGADRNIANTEYLRAIARCGHDGPVETGEVRGVVRDRPGEPGSAVRPVDRKKMLRPQLHLATGPAVKKLVGP